MFFYHALHNFEFSHFEVHSNVAKKISKNKVSEQNINLFKLHHKCFLFMNVQDRFCVKNEEIKLVWYINGLSNLILQFYI